MADKWIAIVDALRTIIRKQHPRPHIADKVSFSWLRSHTLARGSEQYCAQVQEGHPGSLRHNLASGGQVVWCSHDGIAAEDAAEAYRLLTDLKSKLANGEIAAFGVDEQRPSDQPAKINSIDVRTGDLDVFEGKLTSADGKRRYSEVSVADKDVARLSRKATSYFSGSTAEEFTADYIDRERKAKRNPAIERLEGEAHAAGYVGGRKLLRAAYRTQMGSRGRGRPKKGES